MAAALLLSLVPTVTANASVPLPEPSAACATFVSFARVDSTHVRANARVSCNAGYWTRISLEVKRSGTEISATGRTCGTTTWCAISATVYDPRGTQSYSAFADGHWGAVCCGGKTSGSTIYRDWWTASASY